ncbi:hypothetical protein BESB_027130 [Besnoitia besnoiti]|uniref:Uncharacterized protein n=1 Tax=Besnoitia besnoiti TaxID=94643 RepID=A0A2A9LXS0_BESBE|nr:uncharacterized protein BESB_027130 [Besnoitia besnoiti]PFH31278.1 hypothetical protein BESB_027130 [Besnoitia besnoiti]
MRAFNRFFSAGGDGGGLFSKAKAAALGAKHAAKHGLASVTEEATNIGKQMANPVATVKDKAKGIGVLVSDSAEALGDKAKQVLEDVGMKQKEAPLEDDSASTRDTVNRAGKTLKDTTKAGEGASNAESSVGNARRKDDEFKAVGEEAIMYGRELTGQSPKEAGEDAARVARTQGVDKAVEMGKRKND